MLRFASILALAVAALACSAVAAPADMPSVSCYIENGAIHVVNISSNVRCVGRSDRPDNFALVRGNNSIVFGALTEVENVTVLFYTDEQCLVEDGFQTCVIREPTVCFIDQQNRVVVNHVYSDIQCIGRVDDPSSFVFNNGNDTTLIFDDPARSDNIMLHLFSDGNCSQTIQTAPFIFCRPANGSFTTTINSVVTRTIFVVDLQTVTVETCPTTTTTTTTASPTPTPACGIPAGPVCFIQNGLIHVRELPNSIRCVSRSDDFHLAFPSQGSIDYGLPAQDSSITVVAFSDGNCRNPAFSLLCIQVPSVCPVPTATSTTAATTTTTVSVTASATQTVITATPTVTATATAIHV